MRLHSGPGSARLVERPAECVLFHVAGCRVTAAAFLRDAHALAARLPDSVYVLNLCHDRYPFTVAFAAAVLRGQVAVLSGDRSPAGVAALSERFPGCTAVTDVPMAAAGLALRVVQASSLPGESSATMPPNPAIPADQVAAIVFTSGTTGAPIAHVKTWGLLAARSKAAGLRFGLDPANPSAVVGTVPPQHMYGFETTVLLPLHAAASSWCGAAFYPGDVQAALHAVDAPRILVTTPLQLRALLRAGTALPTLRAVISATAPLDAELAAEAEARWQTRVLEIFGASEVGSIASRRTTRDADWTCYPGVAVEPRGADTLVTAPYAPPLPLADLVEASGSGRFRVLGRRTDLVKLGGRRASLSGLTSILTALPGVADGVFLAPDDLESRANARLLAFVVAPERSASAILADLRGRVDPLFLPRRVVRVERLPRNEFGKLPRQALLSLLAQAEPASRPVEAT